MVSRRDKYVNWIVVGTLLFCFQFCISAQNFRAPLRDPIEILQNYNHSNDTTELTVCLSHVNQYYEKFRSKPLFNELLLASRNSERRNDVFLSSFYSILKKHYDGINNNSKSFEYALKIFSLLSKMHKEDDMLWILIDIGNIFYGQKDYRQAKIFYKRAEKVAAKLDDKYPLSVVYMNYGLIEGNQGNHKSAIKYYKISNNFRLKSDNVKVASTTFGKISTSFLHIDQPDSCWVYLKKAEEYYYTKGQYTVVLQEMPDYIDYIYAEYYAYQKQYRKAITHIRKAQKYCLENNFLYEYIVDVDAESNYYYSQNKHQEGIKCLNKVFPIVQKYNMVEEEKQAYKKLSKFYIALGNYQKTSELLTLSLKLDQKLDSLDVKSQLKMIKSISAAYESDELLEQSQKRLELAKLSNHLEKKQRNIFIVVMIISVTLLLTFSIFIKNLKNNEKRLLVLRDQVLVQNNEIANKSQELTQTNQLKDKLFSVIAHDLRNPLNRMLVELAIVKKTFPERQSTLQMERTLKETIELFEGLLQWSKLDNKQNVYSPVKLNLSESIYKILAIYENEIIARGIKVTTKAPQLFVFADQNIIQTLLRNLISNGLNFAALSEKLIEFNIEMKEIEGNLIELYVSNTGPRLTQQTIDEFENLQHQIMSGETNLGLSICKMLAKTCHWHIEIGNNCAEESVYLKIHIPKFIDSKNNILQSGKYAFQLSNTAKKILLPLKEYRFYQTSQIRAFIKSIENDLDENINFWLQHMELAVHEGDEKTFNALIALLENTENSEL